MSHVVLLYTAAVFWYKPDSSHKHLYPARKNERGEPIECLDTRDGRPAFEVDPDGIEIFTNM